LIFLRARLRALKRAFDVEAINIDDLIATAMDDPEAAAAGMWHSGGSKSRSACRYKQFCKNETIATPVVDVREVIEFYNRTLADLPDHTRLKGGRLPGQAGARPERRALGRSTKRDQRRVWAAWLTFQFTCSRHLSGRGQALYEHKGIDERALVRSFIGNLTQSRASTGGSTITQQVVKNLLVGDELSYERKMPKWSWRRA